MCALVLSRRSLAVFVAQLFVRRTHWGKEFMPCKNYKAQEASADLSIFARAHLLTTRSTRIEARNLHLVKKDHVLLHALILPVLFNSAKASPPSGELRLAVSRWLLAEKDTAA